MRMNLLKKIGLVGLFVFIAQGIGAQVHSGYYGSFHGLEFRVGGVPTLHRSNKLKTNNDDELLYLRKLNLIRVSYHLNYSYLIGRKLELLAGYEYSSMRTPNRTYFESSGGIQYLLNDTRINRHGGDFHLRFYRRGSIAPIGKYRGIGLSYDVASVPNSLEFVGGLYGSIQQNSNFLTRKNLVNTTDTITLHTSELVRYSVFSIYASMGRNYPITAQLLFNFNFAVKILGIYSNGSSYELGRELGRDLDDIFSKYYTVRLNGNTNNNLRDDAILETLNSYNRIRLEIGLKYYL